MLENLPDRYENPGERGCVYEFIEPKSGEFEGKHVLVVSSNDRAYDKIVSIMMLSARPVGADIVAMKVQGKKLYAHAGLVTYCSRTSLGRKVCKVADKTMVDVDGCLMYNLGIGSDTWLEERARAESYKELYLELLGAVMGKEEN